MIHNFIDAAESKHIFLYNNDEIIKKEMNIKIAVIIDCVTFMDWTYFVWYPICSVQNTIHIIGGTYSWAHETNKNVMVIQHTLFTVIGYRMWPMVTL